MSLFLLRVFAGTSSKIISNDWKCKLHDNACKHFNFESYKI